MPPYNQQAKDPLIGFRSVIIGKDSKGGDRFQLFLTQEEAVNLANALGTSAEGAERGVKLDIHIADRQTNDGSRTFKSAYTFVKVVQEAAGSGYGANTSPAAPKKFKAKAPTTLGKPAAVTSNTDDAA